MSDATKRNLAIALIVAALGYLGFQIMRGGSTPTAPTHYRILMDSETGEIFKIKHASDNEPYPMTNPKTGERTLYPTEVCYWNECGDTEEGTRVILNHWLGKEGPTVCPKCGREVTRRNPVPKNRQRDAS